MALCVQVMLENILLSAAQLAKYLRVLPLIFVNYDITLYPTIHLLN